jgi:ubiquinone/menaquinone biosynthesis C-methylase UbiE
MDDKERRERHFHDKAFSDSTREAAWKFYAVTIHSRAYYEELVTRHAAGGLVLDCGCGKGANAQLLASVADHVVAIDLSDVALQKAQKRLRDRGCTNVSFGAMNAEYLGLADRSCDFVAGKSVIHHLDLDRALPELARVLKPGGMAIFLEPLGHNPLINAYRRRTPNFRTMDEHPLTTVDLTNAERYFKRVDVRYFTLFTLLAFPLRKTRWFRLVLDFLTGVDQAVFRMFPYLSRHAWQIVLTLSEPKQGRNRVQEVAV